MTAAACTTNAELVSAVGAEGQGYAFVPGGAMREMLSREGPLDGWDEFAASWDRLPVDPYMADGGRYRRRRYATLDIAPGGPIVEVPHQPHVQSLDYNPLHGGIARWFEPIEPIILAGAPLSAILAFARGLFGRIAVGTPHWRVEVHQFRIEARLGEPGRPTPEGLHRDGVDYVLVLLINRRNIASGVTSIHRLDGATLGRFTLTDPFDAALVDDTRVAHGVTAVEPIDPTAPAYRDVLVVTFRKNNQPAGQQHLP
jgi:hypothetical protein